MKDIYSEQIKKKRNEILEERQNFQNQKDSWEKHFSEQKMRLEKIIEILKEYKYLIIKIMNKRFLNYKKMKK